MNQPVRKRVLTTALVLVAGLALLQQQLASKQSASTTPELESTTTTLGQPAASTALPQHAAQYEEQDVDKPVEKAAQQSVPKEQRQQFQTLSERTLQSLVRQKDLRELSEHETHGTPIALLRSGMALGSIAEAVKSNPALQPQAIDFYSKCASTADAAHSIRALCLARYRLLTDAPGSLPSGKIPEAVIALSRLAQVR